MSLTTTCLSYLSILNNFICNALFPPSSKELFFEMPPLGEDAYRKCFGSIEIDPVPPLPNDLLNFLEEPCFFWPNKKNKETHVAIWIAPKINQEPLLTKNLSKLLEQQTKGVINPAASFSIENEIPITEGYWALVTKLPIPISLFKSYKAQCNSLEKYPDYRPARVLEIGLSTLMVYYILGVTLFSHGISTRCEEQEGSWPIVVGSNHFPFALELFHGDWDRPHGIAAVRRFYPV